MKNIRIDGFQSGKECPEKRQNKAPNREVVVTIRAADDSIRIKSYQIIIVKTDASPTPSITGMRLNTLRVVNLLPNIVEDRIIVKIGVAARTT